MQNIKNFTSGNAKTPEQLELANKHRVLFLFSEDGQEWYESQKKFAADTIKFSYDSNGVIRSISRDVSALWPVDLSVAEVPDTTANRRADISGRWGFDGTNIIDLMTLEKARRMKRDEINRWRDNQEDSNTTFEYEGRRWDAGKASQERLSSILALTRTAALPDGFYWTDADNNDVSITPDVLAAINENMTSAMVAQGWKIHERQRNMKKEVDELVKVNEILNYSVGWGKSG
ncbi:DUF4376 domain-containing protein [Salmonella enterica]|nr:DUF4376 domain-containing protein [Salmonella enterica]